MKKTQRVISMRQASHMETARIEAQKSPCLFKHGAVAVVNGRILARGHNTYRTHSSDGFIHDCCTCHAEIAVLRQIFRRHNHSHAPLHRQNMSRKTRGEFKKVVLYVIRQTRQNECKPSAPCMDCMKLIKTLNIKKIIYSDEDMTVSVTTPQEYYTDRTTHGFNYLNKT